MKRGRQSKKRDGGREGGKEEEGRTRERKGRRNGGRVSEREEVRERSCRLPHSSHDPHSQYLYSRRLTP